MNQEFYYHLLQGLRAKATGYVCLVTSVCLLSSLPLQKEEATKVTTLVSALALSLAGQVCFKTQKENEEALEDFRVNSGIQRQRKLFGLPKPEVIEAELEEQREIEWFDFSAIGNDRDKFPNVIIMGEPGSGKTSLAEYLGIVLKANRRYAIHPHAKPNDFAGFNAVLGGGRNYGKADDAEVTWDDIESGRVKPTIAQTLKALLVLMNDRYKRYYQGDATFEDIDVYIDELPSIVANLGKKFIVSIMPQLLMECRKVGIRLWLLAQGSQVKFLGLEGMSDLREGITFIRLGRLALKHNRDQEVSELLSKMNRPCLVDEAPAILPNWAEIQAAIASRQSKPEKPKISKELESLLQQDDEPKPEYTEDEYLMFDTPDKGKQRTLRYEVYYLVDDALELKKYDKLERIVKRSNYDREVMRYIGEALVTRHDKSSSAVIKEGWGLVGDNFSKGKTIFYELGLNLLTRGAAQR